MSNIPLVAIDNSLWTSRILTYAKLMKIKVRDAIIEEFRFTMERVIKLTPPANRAQGEGATQRDIRRVFQPFNPANIRTERLRMVVSSRDIEAFNAIAANVKGGPMKGKRAVRMNVQLHTNARNRRGQVLKSQNQVVLGTDASLLTKYLKEVKGYVGVAKAGWIPALVRVGGSDPNAWISRHRASGTVIDQLNEQSPSITAINRTPWAVRKDEGNRIISSAFIARSRDIGTKIMTQIRLAREESKLGK